MAVDQTPPLRRIRGESRTVIAIVALIAITVALTITHFYVVPPVVRAIGTLLGHQETALRVGGWCLGGGAWVVGGVVVFVKPSLLRVRPLLWALVAWILANAPFLPARSQSGDAMRRLLGSGFHDGRLFLFGLGAGLLAAVVAVVGDLLLALLGGHGPFRPRGPLMRGTLTAWYFLALAGGLAFALLGSAPTNR